MIITDRFGRNIDEHTGERVFQIDGRWMNQRDCETYSPPVQASASAMSQPKTNYTLNRRSLECLKALVRAGKFIDIPWNFTAADSNALLGDPPNWTEFEQNFLGIAMGTPEFPLDPMNVSYEHKTTYAYPYAKLDGLVNLDALRKIVATATASGDGDIAQAAKVALTQATAKTTDSSTVSGVACDRGLVITASNVILAAASGERIPTFTADCYTGGPMRLDGWSHPVVIDYDGLDFTDKSRPVLRDHDPKLPLGHTTNLTVRDGILKAEGAISGSGEYVDEVVEAAKKGMPWQVSVGANVVRNQFVPDGSKAQANGQTWTGPINIARQTTLREISFLTLGADDNTSVRIAAKQLENL